MTKHTKNQLVLSESVKPSIEKEYEEGNSSQHMLFRRRQLVYSGLCKGYPLVAIARKLGVSERTVRRDVQYIYRHYVDIEKEVEKIVTQATFAGTEAFSMYERLKKKDNDTQAQYYFALFLKSLDLRARLVKTAASTINLQINNNNNNDNDDELQQIFLEAKQYNESNDNDD